MTRAGEGFHTARKAPVVSEKFWEGWAACLQEIPPPPSTVPEASYSFHPRPQLLLSDRASNGSLCLLQIPKHAGGVLADRERKQTVFNCLFDEPKSSVSYLSKHPVKVIRTGDGGPTFSGGLCAWRSCAGCSLQLNTHAGWY